MTHYSKDRERQYDEGPSIWLWGKYVAPVVYDLVDTMWMVWEQTCVPAFNAFGSMAGGVMKICVFSWFQTIGNARTKHRQAIAAFRNERNARQLSTESAIHLRKIQGTIGETWAKAAQQPIRSHRTHVDRWADARWTHSVKMAENPWQGALIPEKTPSRNAPSAHEDILGLDDIYDRPVTGLFLDDPLPASKTPVAARDERRPITPPSAKPMSRRPAVSTPQAASTQGESWYLHEETQAVPVHPQPLVAASASHKGPSAPRVPLGKGLHPGRPYAESASSDDWYEGMEEALDGYGYPVANNSEPYGTQPERSNAGTGDGSGRNLPPTRRDDGHQPGGKLPSDVTPGMLEAASQEYPEQAVPWFAQETDNPLAALNEAPVSNVPWSAAQQPDPPAQKQPPRSIKPLAPASPVQPKEQAIEKKAPPPLPKPLPPAAPPQPLSLDHELEEDLSACDYMVQNNRILANSISNLVENYFRQASLEEEPNFY